MTKIKLVIEFLIVAMMVSISVLILPQVSSAQTTKDTQSGCKVQNEDDDDDADEKANQSEYAKEAKITMAEARATALKRVPGTILEEELEKEKGRLQYAFDICSENKQIYDVEIDAKTGEVLKAGLDDEDDDDDGNQQSKEMRKENIFVKTASSVKKTIGKLF